MFIKILGKDVKVIYKEFENPNQLGLFACDPKPFIQLKPGMCKRQRNNVLLHEMIHGLLWMSGASACLDGNLEEIIVLCLDQHIENIVCTARKSSKE